MIDYLVDEVLVRQPDGVRDFLLRTAVLERLTGPLCDAVTGQAGGAAMLDGLERANLFLVPLDDERAWYRYHHLFADVLHARCSPSDPDWSRGCTGGRATGTPRTAWSPRPSGTRWPPRTSTRAAYLVRGGASRGAARRARTACCSAGPGRCRETVVRRSPVLSVVAGWARMMSGDLDGLESRLDDADAALAAGAA